MNNQHSTLFYFSFALLLELEQQNFSCCQQHNHVADIAAAAAPAFVWFVVSSSSKKPKLCHFQLEAVVWGALFFKLYLLQAVFTANNISGQTLKPHTKYCKWIYAL